jgi:hypothetical protein
MNNFGIVAKVNELLAANPVLSIGILILTLALADIVGGSWVISAHARPLG